MPDLSIAREEDSAIAIVAVSGKPLDDELYGEKLAREWKVLQLPKPSKHDARTVEVALPTPYSPAARSAVQYDEPEEVISQYHGEKEKVSPLFLVRSTDTPPRRLSILQQWEGRIVEVTSDSFWAELHDLTTPSNPIESAEVSLDEVSPADSPLVTQGAVFYWHIGYENTPSGAVRRVSEIRLKRNPLWSLRMIERAKSEALAMKRSFSLHGETPSTTTE